MLCIAEANSGIYVCFLQLGRSPHYFQDPLNQVAVGLNLTLIRWNKGQGCCEHLFSVATAIINPAVCKAVRARNRLDPNVVTRQEAGTKVAPTAMLNGDLPNI